MTIKQQTDKMKAYIEVILRREEQIQDKDKKLEDCTRQIDSLEKTLLWTSKELERYKKRNHNLTIEHKTLTLNLNGVSGKLTIEEEMNR